MSVTTNKKIATCMQQLTRPINNQDGFLIVMCILLLAVLLIIGIASTNNTSIELFIARNEVVHQQTFYEADGGTEVGIVLTENALFNEGFTPTAADNTVSPALTNTMSLQNNIVVVTTTDLHANDPPANPPSDANRDAYYPNNYGTATDPHTNLRIGGRTRGSSGAGLQMVAGYEGLGKSAARGGTHMLFDIYSQHIGLHGSDSTVLLEWLHANN